VTLLPINPQVFAILNAFVEEHLGIHYEPCDQELFADKVATRALQAGFESLLDYYYYLRYDAGGKRELDALVDALVVNETYFFREPDQLRVLVDTLIAPILATGARPRIWCAAASTGEEPLTLAMILDEKKLLHRVDVVASDVSPRALARCQEGTYGARSLRALPDGYLGRDLHPTTDGRFEVRPALRRAITWRRVNLIDDEQVRALGEFDAILCRNVLIYFAENTVRTVAERMGDLLHPGGFLLVGASESLLRFGTRLACEEHGGAFFYRKER
jgi:chemotaxis protein methyltransferase CheR